MLDNKYKKFGLNNIEKNLIKLKKKEINIETNQIITIIKKNNINRNLDENALIYYYLLNITNIKNYFIKKNISQKNIEKILSLSIPKVKYLFFKEKNKIIFSPNDISNHFYIIINGNVSVQTIKKYTKYMTGFEYYKLISGLKKKNEIYLIEKIISENYIDFPIQKEDLNILDDIVLKIFLLKEKNKYNKKGDWIENVFEKLKLKYENYGIESYKNKILRFNKEKIKENESQKDNVVNKIENKIKEQIEYNEEDEFKNTEENFYLLLDKLENINDFLIEYYIFLVNSENYIETILYKYEEINQLKKNDFFGEFNFDTYIYRTISVSENLELLCINNKIFKEYIKSENDKLIENRVLFLTLNFFFKKIFRNKFKKLYYHYFEYEKYKKDDIIFKENEKANYLYFIEKGEIFISYNKNIIENINIIKKIEEYLGLKEFEKKFIHFKDEIFTMKEKLFLKDKKILFYLKNKFMIGIESIFFNINYLYTSVVKSENLTLFKILKSNLNKIFEDNNKESFNLYMNMAKEKLLILYNRLIKINNEKFNLEDNREEYKEEVLKKDKIIKNISNYTIIKQNFNIQKNKKINKSLDNLNKLNLKNNILIPNINIKNKRKNLNLSSITSSIKTEKLLLLKCKYNFYNSHDYNFSNEMFNYMNFSNRVKTKDKVISTNDNNIKNSFISIGDNNNKILLTNRSLIRNNLLNNKANLNKNKLNKVKIDIKKYFKEEKSSKYQIFENNNINKNNSSEKILIPIINKIIFNKNNINNHNLNIIKLKNSRSYILKRQNKYYKKQIISKLENSFFN